jgi:hypothetical protein
MNEPSRIPVDRPSLHVADAPERHRYEARLGAGGELAALVTYDLSETWIALLHTEVQERFEGLGIGSQLIERVFDDVRQRGLRIIPRCPFVVRWLERHPEQHDVLSHPLRPAAVPPPDDPPEPA